jgi:hypothetical protein
VSLKKHGLKINMNDLRNAVNAVKTVDANNYMQIVYLLDDGTIDVNEFVGTGGCLNLENVDNYITFFKRRNKKYTQQNLIDEILIEICIAKKKYKYINPLENISKQFSNIFGRYPTVEF